LEAITLHSWTGFSMAGRSPCPIMTPFGLKVQRVLQYKGLAFSWREVGFRDAPHVLPGLSRSGKLPVLEIDGELIEDSTRIAWRLEALRPEPSLIPAEPAARGRVDLLEQWSDDVLYRYRQYAELHFTPPEVLRQAYYAGLPDAEAERLLAGRREGIERQLHHQGIGRYPEDAFRAEFARTLDGLAALADAQGFLTGEAPTLADLAVFGHFERVLAGADPWYEDELRARPPLLHWIAEVDLRTAPGGER